MRHDQSIDPLLRRVNADRGDSAVRRQICIYAPLECVSDLLKQKGVGPVYLASFGTVQLQPLRTDGSKHKASRACTPSRSRCGNIWSYIAFSSIGIQDSKNRVSIYAYVRVECTSNQAKPCGCSPCAWKMARYTRLS
jgi:hypothetical protein